MCGSVRTRVCTHADVHARGVGGERAPAVVWTHVVTVLGFGTVTVHFCTFSSPPGAWPCFMTAYKIVVACRRGRWDGWFLWSCVLHRRWWPFSRPCERSHPCGCVSVLVTGGPCLCGSVRTRGAENVRCLGFGGSSDMRAAVLHAAGSEGVTLSLCGHHTCAWLSPILPVTVGLAVEVS